MRLVRFLVECVGLFVMSIGIALSIHSGLGTTPISSLPLVLAYMSGYSVGITTIALNFALIGLQIAILRRRYQPIQLLQAVVTAVFGLLIDVSVNLTSAFQPSNYFWQWVLTLAGIVCVGMGVAIQVTAQSVILAGEGTVLVISNELLRVHKGNPRYAFGNVKIANDVTMVVLSVILAFIFLGELAGVREGTIAAAFGVGIVAKFGIKLLRPFGVKVLGNAEER